MINKNLLRKGFTLIEVMVALTISGVLLTILIKSFFDTYIFSQEMAVRASLLQDSKVIFDSIAQEIEEGEVDYEEYFNQCVVKNNCPNSQAFDAETQDPYGDKHGLYAWQFYDGGVYYEANGEIQDGAGSLCQVNGAGGYEVRRVPNPDCVSGVLSYSEDFNTGVSSHFSPGLKSFAVCTSRYYEISNTKNDGTVGPLVYHSGNGCGGNEGNVFTELYLISKDGKRKTIFAKERVSYAEESYAISKLELVADETEFIGNQSLTTFVCSEEYDCSQNNNTMVERKDLVEANKNENWARDFVPISPLKVNVESLKFVIEPLEDPEKAFGEFDKDTQIPPKVTILMTLRGSPDYYFFGLDEDYSLSLQRTVVVGGI